MSVRYLRPARQLGALVLIAGLSLSLTLWGCTKKKQQDDPTPPPANTPSGGTGEQGSGSTSTTNPGDTTTGTTPADPVSTVTPGGPTAFGGAHILIAYAGAMRAKPNVTRTKAEAQAFAGQVRQMALADPSKFGELAKKHSDGPSGRVGGILGRWTRGRMVPAFQVAIDKLKIGEISGLVETRFGYHIIKRLPPSLAGSHILIMYAGSKRSRATRTKAEAVKLAKELAAKLKKDPKQFAALATKHSDGPSKTKGGSLGTWPLGRMVPAFRAGLLKLKVGEVSDPVETPFGFHVIQRAAPTNP